MKTNWGNNMDDDHCDICKYNKINAAESSIENDGKEDKSLLERLGPNKCPSCRKKITWQQTVCVKCAKAFLKTQSKGRN